MRGLTGRQPAYKIRRFPETDGRMSLLCLNSSFRIYFRRHSLLRGVADAASWNVSKRERKEVPRDPI